MTPVETFRPAIAPTSNGYLAAIASNVAYLDADKIEAESDRAGFKAYMFVDHEDTQAYVFFTGEAALVAFRGTEPDSIQDILTDLQVTKTDGPFGGSVHRGFRKAFDAVWDDHEKDGQNYRGLRSILLELREDNPQMKFHITGHSLGGALATLCAAAMCELPGISVTGVYTFGSPRVGDDVFAEKYDAKLRQITHRFVNNNDVVTVVPPYALGYVHVGRYQYIPEAGDDVHEDPGSLYVIADQALGRLYDVGEVGTDGIKDHSMIRTSDLGRDEGYLPSLRKAFGITEE